MRKKKIPVKIEERLDEAPSLKPLGGSNADQWNKWLSDLTLNALSVANSKSRETIISAAVAVCRGTMDIAPADPVEGILVAQLMAANDAALVMYQKAWAQPPDYFHARTKYLQLADKAARTVIMLTERLDHHRARGRQHITVKHVTVNADQAIVGDVQQHEGGSHPSLIKEQPHAIAVAPRPTLSCTNEAREPLSVSGDEKRPLPDARGHILRTPKRE